MASAYQILASSATTTKAPSMAVPTLPKASKTTAQKAQAIAIGTGALLAAAMVAIVMTRRRPAIPNYRV